jgi:hypothetical protein
MLLSYYTRICIPIIGLNLKQPDFHYKIMVHNTGHKHASDIVKTIVCKINYPIAIRCIEQTKIFDNILLTARSPPILLVVMMLYPYYHLNIKRW